MMTSESVAQYTINPQGTSDKNKAQLDRGFYQTILAWVKGIAANPGGTNAYEQSQSAALANFSQPILAAPQNYGQPATYLNQPEQTRQPQQPQQPQQPEQAQQPTARTSLTELMPQWELGEVLSNEEFAQMQESLGFSPPEHDAGTVVFYPNDTGGVEADNTNRLVWNHVEDGWMYAGESPSDPASIRNYSDTLPPATPESTPAANPYPETLPEAAPSQEGTAAV